MVIRYVGVMINEMTVEPIVQRRAQARCALPCAQNYYNLRQYIKTIRALAHKESAVLPNTYTLYKGFVLCSDVVQHPLSQLSQFNRLKKNHDEISSWESKETSELEPWARLVCIQLLLQILTL